MKKAKVVIFESKAEADKLVEKKAGFLVTELEPRVDPVQLTEATHATQDGEISIKNGTQHTLWLVTAIS